MFRPIKAEFDENHKLTNAEVIGNIYENKEVNNG